MKRSKCRSKYRSLSVRKKTRKHMRGGTWKGVASGPVGFSWQGGETSSWPGVAGVDGQSNHYPVSKYGVPTGNFELPVSTSNIMKGGKKRRSKRCRSKKRRRRRRSRRGGCGCSSSADALSSSRKMHGGSGLIRGRLFPSDLVNAYRGIVNTPSRWMNTYSGNPQPANLNVSPTSQPINNTKMPHLDIGGRIGQGQTSTSARSFVKAPG